MLPSTTNRISSVHFNERENSLVEKKAKGTMIIYTHIVYM